MSYNIIKMPETVKVELRNPDSIIEREKAALEALSNVPVDDPALKRVIEDILMEYRTTKSKYTKDYNSPHEGHSVLREEVDELWDEVRANRGRTRLAYNEAKQIASVAIRYMIEVCRNPE